MATTKEYLIKTVYDSAGLKKFVSDVEAAKRAAGALGTDLGNTARVIDTTVVKSFDKSGEQVRRVSTTFEENGKRMKVSFTETAQGVDAASLSIKQLGQTIEAAGAKIQTINQPISGIGAKLTQLSSLNRTFARTFGDSFKQATAVVEQFPEKLSQKKISINGKDFLVPVQQLSTVVQTADGQFQKLNQTILTLPNGVKQISRSMTDVSASYIKAKQEAERLARVNQEATASFQKVAVSAQQAERGARFFTTGLSKSAQLMDISSKTLVSNGQEIVRSTATFSDSGKKITTVFDSTATSTTKVSQAMGPLGSSIKKVDIDLGKLISRALVTIPVWFALRAAITGVFFGIRDGVKNLITFDEALQKVKRNLTGTPEEIAANFSTMKKEITDFSLKTGKSVEEISNAIKQFATIGFSFKDSLSAGLDATKLSIALFGEAGDTAKAFAVAMKLLIKEGKGLPPVSQQITESFALVAELAKTNKDELGELSQAFEKIAGPAAVAKLSFKETATILLTLASSGKAGAQGATLLGTALTNLLTNLPKVSQSFGVDFIPGVDSAYTTLTKILDVAAELAKTPSGEASVFAKLGDVFGGQRGIKLVSSLLAANEALKQNANITADVVKFNKSVDDVLDSESGQAKILANNIRELGKNFIVSVVGAKEFKDVISSLNGVVTNLQPAFSKLGITIGNFGKIITGQFSTLGARSTSDVDTDRLEKKFQATQQKLAKALRGELSKVELDQFKVDFKEGKAILDTEVPLELINAALDKALSTEQVTAKVAAAVELSPKVSTKAEVTRSLENELAELKAKLKAKGATDIELELLDIAFLQTKSIGEEEKIRDAQSKVRVATIERERTIQDALLQAVQDNAIAEGASTLQALNKRIELEKSLGIARTGLDLLNQQLDLQKALTEESKKTKKERLDELEALVRKAPSPFSGGGVSKEIGDNFREQKLIQQASLKGIDQTKVDAILNPASAISEGNSLLNDLQNGLAQPMTRSMGALESAIVDLTSTILRQETRTPQVSLPKFSKTESAKAAAKAATEKTVEEF